MESTKDLENALIDKINSVDFSLAKRDIAPFIEDRSVLDIWSKEYFSQLVKMIRFE